MKNKKQPKTPAIPAIGKCLETPDAASFSQTAKAFTAIKPGKVILSGNDDVAAWEAKLNQVIHVGFLKIENVTQIDKNITFAEFKDLLIEDY